MSGSELSTQESVEFEPETPLKVRASVFSYNNMQLLQKCIYKAKHNYNC